MMTPNHLSLFCVFDGDALSEAFAIKIDNTESISDFKKIIKAENAQRLENIDAGRLTLWRVSIDGTKNVDKPTLLTEIPAEEREKLLPVSLLAASFSDVPKGYINVVVQVPAAGPDQTSRKRVAMTLSGSHKKSHMLAEKLPIGMDSFRCVIEGDFKFVDKSMLIAEFLERSSQVSLILRPRRFGKSLNLSMMQYFFEKTDQDRPRSAGMKARRELFHGLNLEIQRPDLFESHFEKYPVIYCSLKDLKSSTWTDMINKTRYLIAGIYSTHSYVRQALEEHEQVHFDRIINADQTYPYLSTTLLELSRFLTRFYQSKCVVLIDEYDAPLDAAYNHQYYDEAKDFFAGLFSSLLKSNDQHIFKALLIGVLRIAKSGFLSGLNNLSVFPMHSNEYSDKFGFTSEEVSVLCKNYGIDHLLKEIQEYYNGYIAGGVGAEVAIYNPWSVVNVCEKKSIGLFWTETGGTSTLEKHLWSSDLEFKENISKLLQKQIIAAPLREDIRYADLENNNSACLWSLLYYSGYVSMDSGKNLFIPNNEVRNQWDGWFAQCLNQRTPIRSLLGHLIAADVQMFSKAFPQVIIQTLSYFDVGSQNSAERFYHAFSLGLFVATRDEGYEITSNREAGKGRYDMMVTPPAHHAVGIVIEFKIVRLGETLEDAAESGLLQIEKMKYRAGMPDNVKKVVEVGISFEGKVAVVKGKVLQRQGDGWVTL